MLRPSSLHAAIPCLPQQLGMGYTSAAPAAVLPGPVPRAVGAGSSCRVSHAPHAAETDGRDFRHQTLGEHMSFCSWHENCRLASVPAGYQDHVVLPVLLPGG